MRRGLGALGGAGLGAAAWLAISGTRPEASPANWVIQDAPVPVEVAALAGELRPDPAALDLWGYRAASPAKLTWTTGRVELDARIPDGAELTLRFGAPMVVSVPAPPVERDTVVVEHKPPPPTQVNLNRDGDGVAIRFDRLRHRTRVSGAIDCPLGPEVGAAPHLVVTTSAGALLVEADGQPIVRCAVGAWQPAAPILAASVRRVQVTKLIFTPLGGDPWQARFGGPLRGPAGAVLGAALGALVGAWVGWPWWVVTGGLAAAAMTARWRETLDAMRLIAFPEALAPLMIGGLPTLVGVVVRGARRSGKAALVYGLFPLAFTSLTLLAGAADAGGWCVLSLLFLPLALVSHGSGRRWHPVALQALLLSTVPLAEVGVRLTRLDVDWSLTAGFTRAQEELRQLLELREYRVYPSEGFPIRPPPKSASKRIVAFGGSSTGGAYQMDDIELFWPRHLQDRLSGWEVVNQGVGGWNTGHIRLYAESQLQHLAPDLVVVYAGHNDLLTRSPISFRSYLATYRAAADTPAPLRALRGFRLYNGLKYSLLAMRDGEGAVAVPLTDAEDNLAAIIGLANGLGAKVLMVTEAVNPDPTALQGYAEMEAALAARTGSAALDARARFFERDEPLDFIDDCHLTVGGHAALATMIEAELRRIGWI